MAEWRERLQRNLERVVQAVQQAAEQAGRDPQSVRLVIVTKSAPVPVARAVAESGYLDLGESRPQELWRKADALCDLQPRWHFVGHLQRNKVRRTVPLVQWIHSVDSVRLLEEIDRACVDQPGLRVLLEVNVSGEAAKHGFRPEELPEIVRQLGRWPHVRVCGLMAMAALAHVGPSAAADFQALRQLRDQLAPLVPAPHELRELSMGMSGDFPWAVREGATMVRIGSAVFEGVELDASEREA